MLFVDCCPNACIVQTQWLQFQQIHIFSSSSSQHYCFWVAAESDVDKDNFITRPCYLKHVDVWWSSATVYTSLAHAHQDDFLCEQKIKACSIGDYSYTIYIAEINSRISSRYKGSVRRSVEDVSNLECISQKLLEISQQFLSGPIARLPQLSSRQSHSLDPLHVVVLVSWGVGVINIFWEYLLTPKLPRISNATVTVCYGTVKVVMWWNLLITVYAAAAISFYWQSRLQFERGHCSRAAFISPS